MASDATKVAEIGGNLDSILGTLQKAGKLDIISAEDLKRMKSMEKLSRDVSKTLVEGGAKNYSLMARNLEAISSRLGGLQQEQMKYLKIYEKAVKSGNENMIKLAEKRLKLANKQMESKKREIELEQKKYTLEYQKLKDLKKEMEFAGSNMQGTIFDPDLNFRNIDKISEYAEGQFGNVADAFGDAMSGSLDSVAQRGISVTRGIAKRLRIAGQQIEAKSGAGGHSKLGGALRLLGKGLAVFGGVAAGLFAVAKAMQAVEEAQKGANKELLDAVGGTDLMVDGTNNLYDAVNKLRKDLADGSFANEMGMTLDEVRGLVGELHNVDITMRSLGGNTYALKDIMKDFQGQAKMLGVSFGEVAEYSNNFRMELGYAASDASFLERMADQFNTIRDLALQSGYNTNKFFQTIKKLTEGVDNMNYRVGQAGKLFLNLSKVLGPKAAEAFAEGLAGGFKGEGVVDRYKRIILTGGKRSKKVIQSVADNAAANFKKRFQGSGQDDFSREKEILQKYGINVEGDKRAIVQALASKSDKERQMIMGELQTTGAKGQGMSRELMGMFDLAKGTKGGLSNMAMALGQMDMMGSMQMQMAQVNAFLGEKGFAGASATQLEALSNYTGKSMEELENMRQIDFMMRGQFMELEKIKQSAKTDAEKTAELEQKGFKGLKFEGGKLVTDTGDEVKNLNDYMASQGSVMEDMKMETTTQNQLLRDQRDATLTSAQMINNHLGGIMQNATDYLGELARNALKNDENEMKRLEMIERQNDIIRRSKEETTAEENRIREEISKKKAELEGVKDVGKIRRVKEEIAKLSEELQTTKSRAGVVQYKARVTKRALRGSKGTELAKKPTGYDETPEQAAERVFLAQVGDMDRTQVAKRLKKTVGEVAEMQAIGDIAKKQQVSTAVARRKYEGYFLRGDKSYVDPRSAGSASTIKAHQQEAEIIKARGLERKSDDDGSARGVYTKTGERVIDVKNRTLTPYDSSAGHDISRGAHVEGDVSTEKAGQSAKEIVAQIAELHHKLKKFDPSDKTSEEKREQIRQQIFLKNKKLKDFYADAQVLAQRKMKRKESEGIVQSILGKDTNLDTANRRDLAMQKLRQKLAGMAADDPNRSSVQRAIDALGASEVFYSTDSRSLSSNNRPMLFRRGTLTVGQPYDQVDMYDPRGRGASGGGGVSNVINVYGGDEKRIVDLFKRVTKANSGRTMG